jgi:hypothetical protein
VSLAIPPFPPPTSLFSFSHLPLLVSSVSLPFHNMPLTTLIFCRQNTRAFARWACVFLVLVFLVLFLSLGLGVFGLGRGLGVRSRARRTGDHVVMSLPSCLAGRVERVGKGEGRGGEQREGKERQREVQQEGEQGEVDQERRRSGRSGSRRSGRRRRRRVYTTPWSGLGASGHARAFSCAYRLWGGE